MTIKFNPKYTLSVTNYTMAGDTPVPLREIVISDPFTLSAEISRSNQSSSAICDIKIYNLARKTRDAIRKDDFDTGLLKSIVLTAGYEGSLSTIFSGDILYAYSERNGPDIITTISCLNTGQSSQFGNICKTYPEGTQLKAIVMDMLINLEKSGIAIGKVGNIEGEITRPATYSGQITNILNEITDGRFFIDNNRTYVLNKNEVLTDKELIIDASTGLLSTPVYRSSIAKIDMLFEASVSVQQLVTVRNSVETDLNGQWKIIGIHHSFNYSYSTPSNLTTSIEMQRLVAPSYIR